MPPKVKTILTWLVVIFLVYAVVTNPDRAAEVLKSIGALIYATFTGFGRFFSSLAS
jgi:hypothetical protein